MTDPRGPGNPGGRRRLRNPDNPDVPDPAAGTGAPGGRRRRREPEDEAPPRRAMPEGMPPGERRRPRGDVPQRPAEGRRRAPEGTPRPAGEPPRRVAPDAMPPAEPPRGPAADAPPTRRRRPVAPQDRPKRSTENWDLPPHAADDLPRARPRRITPDEVPVAGNDLPPAEAEPPAGRRRRREDVPPVDAPAGRRRLEDAPPPVDPPAGRRRRREDIPPPVDVEPPSGRRRRDDVELPAEAAAPGRRRAPEMPPPPPVRRAPAPPPDGSMPPDPRFADASMPPDPRFAEASMPRDPRFADASMPPDPRFAEASMPRDPRFADASMPRDPRSQPPRRQPVEQPTEVIPAVPAAAHEPEHPDEQPIDGLFEDEYDEYGEYEDYDEDYDGYDEDGYPEDGAEPPVDEPPAKKPRKKRKRAIGWIAAVLVLVLLSGGAYFGYQKIFGYADFDGSGEGDALVQVEQGDTTSAIGAKLTDAGVVASSRAFVKAGAENTALSKIQQGYYLLRQHMSGENAVDLITSPAARVGRLEIRPYTQFDDITQPDGKVTPGVFSLMSKASCATLNGKSTCIPVDQLRKTVADADLKALGAPEWALADAGKALSKDKRLEGLIAPGVYDVKPGWSATELITDLVKQSADSIQAAGLTAQNTGPGKSPYETLIIASLIEREAIKPDFGKISRVIYNRLTQRIRLQLDSTVNYVLDRPTLLTKPEDRAKAGPYNTYANYGLPPTPIAVPSMDAIKAAVSPTPGDWVYFVKCEKDGHSCFAVTNDQHNANRTLAEQRGVIK
ncbi:endolytic transglycosylase MltG [Amycolatopsis sp. Poz14]|uniref:endolytic transglycosylase MltG n=1 Tax=Amycolatopsis sp. Poz14 TaxID=1447705 RepID=UPI0027154821|nr:endolytic transglycosylase MltG [Amycolatopsis sp. Poz14]